MRFRSRSWSVSDRPHYTVTGSWRDNFDGPYPYPVHSRIRTLEDWIGKHGIEGKLPSSPCDDLRAEFIPADIGPWFSYWTGSRRSEHSSGHFYWNPAGFTSDFLSRAPGASSLAQQAFDAFSDQVPEDISLGNFALEWREAVELIPNLIEHFARARPYLSKMGRRNLVRGSSATEDASKAFLQWNFAVAPLIGDLQALSNLVSSTSSRLQWIRDHNGKETRMFMKSTRPYPVVPAIPPSVKLWIPGTDTWDPVATLRRGTGVFTAQCRLAINIPLKELDGMIGFCRAFIGRTGLNDPFSIIWNAIPFSFVLDWFLRFSDMLSRRKVHPFNGEWAVRDFTWSLKQTTEWEVEQPYLDRPFMAAQQPLYRGLIRVTRYQRGLGLPENELGTLLKGACTPKQAALLLALSR